MKYFRLIYRFRKFIVVIFVVIFVCIIAYSFFYSGRLNHVIVYSPQILINPTRIKELTMQYQGSWNIFTFKKPDLIKLFSDDPIVHKIFVHEIYAQHALVMHIEENIPLFRLDPQGYIFFNGQYSPTTLLPYPVFLPSIKFAEGVNHVSLSHYKSILTSIYHILHNMPGNALTANSIFLSHTGMSVIRLNPTLNIYFSVDHMDYLYKFFDKFVQIMHFLSRSHQNVQDIYVLYSDGISVRFTP